MKKFFIGRKRELENLKALHQRFLPSLAVRCMGKKSIKEFAATTLNNKFWSFAVIPVLFHISGVSEPVEMSNYFYRIIDITDFLPAK